MFTDAKCERDDDPIIIVLIVVLSIFYAFANIMRIIFGPRQNHYKNYKNRWFSNTLVRCVACEYRDHDRKISAEKSKNIHGDEMFISECDTSKWMDFIFFTLIFFRTCLFHEYDNSQKKIAALLKFTLYSWIYVLPLL